MISEKGRLRALSKDSLIKGTLILALAALIARVLGAVQRIPLIQLLDDAGMATYSIAFNIYMMLLVVATAGIPSALSKLVSERTALGRLDEANRIYRAAILFALAVGLLMTVLLFAAAPYYAVHMAKDPDASLSIRTLAPALLLFPLIAIMRGYFQGRQRMMPNGISQVVEQIVRIIAAIGLAYLLLQIGWGHTWAVAGASFGGVVGSVGAVLVMLAYAVKLRREDRNSGGTPAVKDGGQAAPLAYKDIYAKLFRLSVPIVLFSLAVPLINAIDSTITIGLLQSDLSYEAAKDALGVLGGRAQSLAGIPIILAIALSQSAVPVISSAYAQKNNALVSSQASKALYVSVLSGLPLVLAICIAARPINVFMFGNDAGTGIIVLLTASALFQIVMQTSGAVLMGIGRMKPLIVHVGIGLVVKLACSYLLAPVFGIYGIIAATALCFIVMAQLNLVVLRRHVDYTILGKKWMGLAATTIVVVAVGFALELFTHKYVQPFGYRLSEMLNSILVGVAVFVLYGLMLVWTKVVTSEDAARLPAPLQKVIRRFKRPSSNAGSGSGN
ncbi:MAG: rane protein [Paenibacillus sp.]|nr:rane protein [Paenibacillus sp.]